MEAIPVRSTFVLCPAKEADANILAEPEPEPEPEEQRYREIERVGIHVSAIRHKGSWLFIPDSTGGKIPTA